MCGKVIKYNKHLTNAGKKETHEEKMRPTRTKIRQGEKRGKDTGSIRVVSLLGHFLVDYGNQPVTKQ